MEASYGLGSKLPDRPENNVTEEFVAPVSDEDHGGIGCK